MSMDKLFDGSDAHLLPAQPSDTHAMEEDFQHFLSYSGLAKDADRLRVAFEAAWSPAQPDTAALQARIAVLEAQLEKALKAANNANSDADMYANAWQRELAAFDGTIRNKRHHIDAMVLTTQDLVRKLKEAQLIEQAGPTFYVHANADGSIDAASLLPEQQANPLAIVQAALEAAAALVVENEQSDIADQIRTIDKQSILDGMSKWA